MNKNVLIICDRDRNYCKKLDSFIRDNMNIPFDIYVITEPERLKGFAMEDKNVILLISQSAFEAKSVNLFKHILVLREKESDSSIEVPEMTGADIRYMDKYQKSENITDSILGMCLDIPGIVVRGKGSREKRKMKITGFYTPAPGSSQTIEAIAYTRRQSENEKVLYINTDCLCTDTLIRNNSYEETILDLMYFAQCAREKFGIYLERIVKHDRNLDFIPAALSACQIRLISLDEYERLFEEIEETGRYSELVLDISEGVRDLFDLLRLCDEIMMVQDNNYYAQMRIEMLLGELQKDESFDMKRLHRYGKNGGDKNGI